MASAVRLVYSSDRSRVCIKCGWPVDEKAGCKCSTSQPEAVPRNPRGITAKLRVESKGRGGKSVTVIDGLPRNPEFLAGLAADLKKACGTGGTFGETSVELQGDRRERLREILATKGYVVKG